MDQLLFAAATSAIRSDSFQASAPPKQTTSMRSRCGRKRFGFYPGESDVVSRMMELRAQGLGFDRIAQKLTEERAPSRSGKAWHGRVVNRILKAAGKAKETHLVP